MAERSEYVLGQSERAARRLEIQDAHFGEISERLLDELQLKPTDRVIELGCGPGSLSKRIVRRLGAGGVLVGVDASEGLINQARQALASEAPARFEPVVADISGLGNWLQGADVVIGRAVLHHVPMVEIVLGRLQTIVRPGTRLGFLEPDFRSPVARLGKLISAGRKELEPLLKWAIVINELYLSNRISPDVGATLARTLELAGCVDVRSTWTQFPSDSLVAENMIMFYDEVRERIASLGIQSIEETDRQQRLLRALPSGPLPAAWGMFRVVCRTGEM
jgi:ubiquinone/menaquinone biosynthesis C-methylase UbiE